MARARKEECYPPPDSDIWYYVLYDDAGRRSKISTGTADKKEADKIRIAAQEKRRRDALLGPQVTLTFGEGCGFYLKAGKSDRFLDPLFALWEHTVVSKLTPGV